MAIRRERPGDEEAISAVITAAFLEADHSGGNEAEIVKSLRGAKGLAVSLVATEGETIVGHAAFSPVTLNGRNDAWFGLGPVAVLPEQQRKGIGSALIEAGIGELRKGNARGCVVLGEPSYYGRFGFIADPAFRLVGVPPEYFQRLSLEKHSTGGTVNYHPAFDVG